MEKERRIYLVRHGELYEDGKIRRCLGHTDVPLAKRGERQAGKIAGWFLDKDIGRIYSSSLLRCVKTAEILKNRMEVSRQGIEIRILEALWEMDAGKWENLSFEEIRRNYSEEYEARGRNLGYYAPPGGESFYQAGIRFGGCLEKIRKETEENILVVTHAGVIRGYLSGLLGISPNDVFTIPQPYAGITVLKETARGLVPERIGWKPSEFLDDEEIRNLYDKCRTPEQTVCHMEAVAQFLDALKKEMKHSDYNWELLKKAALVHDICRTQRQHARKGAEVLREEGYEEIAKLVEGHHSSEGSAGADYGEMPQLSEEELLFYADKRVREDQIVSLEERFKASMWKCRTSEAKEKRHSLYRRAQYIERKINGVLEWRQRK